MSFTKAELVTGDLVKVASSDGAEYARVYLGTDNGDIISGHTWFPLKDYPDARLFGDEVHDWSKIKILEVHRPKTNMNFKEDKPSEYTHTLLWKRDTTFKARAELRELEQQLKELRSRARELNEIINDGKL